MLRLPPLLQLALCCDAAPLTTDPTPLVAKLLAQRRRLPARKGGARRGKPGAPARDHGLLDGEVDNDEYVDVRAGGAAPPTPPEPKEALQHIICFLVL